MTTLSNKTRVSLPVAARASLLLGVGGGVAGAVTTVYSLKEQVLTAACEERRRELSYYVTREGLGRTRERDRDRLDQKQNETQVKVRALAAARNRR